MSFAFGGKEKNKQEARLGNIRHKDFPTNEAARSAPVLFGIHKLGVTFLSGLFDQESQPITESFSAGSKKKQTMVTGYNYRTSFAAFICVGQIDELRTIYSGDEILWSGSLYRTSADGNGMTPITTENGIIRFYWGSSSQGPDSYLAHGIAYRNCCYIVVEKFFLGTNTTPPSLSFVVRRETYGLSLSAHQISSDAIVPEIIYNLLTDQVYGAGIPASHLDTDSFTSAAEQLITEGLGISPNFSKNQTIRAVIADLMPYINGSIFYDGGKIRFLLERESTSIDPIFIVDPSYLIEEPQIQRGSWSDTWSETRVSYTDRDRDFNDNVATFHDPANSDIQGRTVQNEISRNHITRESIAFKIAYNVGKFAGIPQAQVKLTLRGNSGTFYPGQRITLNYAPLEIVALPLRIRRVSFGDPFKPTIEIEAVEDLTRLTKVGDFNSSPGLIYNPTLPIPQNAFFRIAALTSEQATSGDGVLVCAQRPHGMIIGASVYATWSLSTDFTYLTDLDHYPLRLSLNRWKRYSVDTFLIDVTVSSSFENTTLQAYREDQSELYLVFGARTQNLASSLNRHEIEPLWVRIMVGGQFEPTGVNQWEIEVVSSQFGSLPIQLESPIDSLNGIFPTQIGFLGRQDDFWTLPTGTLKFKESGANHPTDTDHKRFVRVLTQTPEDIEELADGATLYFDRNDGSMSPDGTFQSDWGPRIPNKEYVSEVLSDAPSVYFRLSETTGSTAFNFTASGHNASISPTGVTLNQTSPVVDILDKSFYFSNGSLVVPDTSALDFTSVLSVEFWIKTSSSGFVLSKAELGVSGYEVSVDINGKLRFFVHYGTVSVPESTILETTNPLNDNSWHHIVFRFNAGQMSVIIDGTLDSASTTAPVTVIPTNSIDLTIAQRSGGSLPLAGYLDEIALYGAPLSNSRALTHYQAGTGVSW